MFWSILFLFGTIFTQTGPWKVFTSIEGEFQIDQFGSYFIHTNLKTKMGIEEKSNAALNIPYPVEYRKIGPDIEVLKTIAEKNSGKFNPDIKDIWSKNGSEIEYSYPLWPYLIFFLIGMIILDIAIRRIPI